MGIRVLFWLGSEDGLAGRFSAMFLSFQEWLNQVYGEFPDDFSPETMELSRRVEKQGLSALRVSSLQEAWNVDLLIDAFILFGQLPDVGTSHLKLWRYETILNRMQANRASEDVIRLWRYLLEGRPILRDASQFPFHSSDDASWTGYWTKEEVQFLRPWIQELEDVDESAQRTTMEAIDAAIAASTSTGLILTVN